MPLEGGKPIPLDSRDPHFALGVEHARAGEPAYQFADAENQRRYIAGRKSTVLTTRDISVDETDGCTIDSQKSLDNFSRLAQQLQPQNAQRIWQSAPGWPLKRP